MIRFQFLWLIGALLAVMNSCQGVKVDVEADSIFGSTKVGVEVPPAGNGESGPTRISLYPDPSMIGLCAQATMKGSNGPVSGPPTLLGWGHNVVDVPAGVGPPTLSFGPWEQQLFSGTYQDEASELESYYYAAVPWAPVPGENIYFFLEVEASSHPQAGLRQAVLGGMYEDLLQGIDPGSLPSYVQIASYMSWHRVDSGPNAGDFVFTAAKPGTQVDDFRLELNDFVATLGNGASAWTVGDWQVVEATVPSEEVHFPSPSGPVTNRYRLTLDTDVGDPLPNSAELSIELLQ